jgi:hypothetical protein
MKADVVFQKDVAGMVRRDLLLDSHSRYPYPAEQPPVGATLRTQSLSGGWYHLDSPDMKTKAAELIKQEKYIFPPSNVSSFLYFTIAS